LFQQLLASWGSPDIDGKDKASLSAPYDVSVVVREAQAFNVVGLYLKTGPGFLDIDENKYKPPW
jgi:hypothetical protein